MYRMTLQANGMSGPTQATLKVSADCDPEVSINGGPFYQLLDARLSIEILRLIDEDALNCVRGLPGLLKERLASPELQGTSLEIKAEREALQIADLSITEFYGVILEMCRFREDDLRTADELQQALFRESQAKGEEVTSPRPDVSSHPY